MKSKMLRATGITLLEAKKKLKRKIWIYKIIGWRKGGYFSWEEKFYNGKYTIIITQEVFK